MAPRRKRSQTARRKPHYPKTLLLLNKRYLAGHAGCDSTSIFCSESFSLHRRTALFVVLNFPLMITFARFCTFMIKDAISTPEENLCTPLFFNHGQQCDRLILHKKLESPKKRLGNPHMTAWKFFLSSGRNPTVPGCLCSIWRRSHIEQSHPTPNWWKVWNFWISIYSDQLTVLCYPQSKTTSLWLGEDSYKMQHARTMQRKYTNGPMIADIVLASLAPQDARNEAGICCYSRW